MKKLRSPTVPKLAVNNKTAEEAAAGQTVTIMSK
jgi:hypothetical protein